MRLYGADAPTDLVASSASPTQAKWPRQQVLMISFAATVRIVNFRCENIVLNTAMNKCQYELYRLTVFSVRNRMDLYRFMTFQALGKVFKFNKIPTQLERLSDFLLTAILFRSRTRYLFAIVGFPAHLWDKNS